jgi:CBS-domain-containing membrane protein
MVAMRVTGTMHPPAAINPIIIVIEQLPATFLLAPVGCGAALLALFAFVWHNALQRGAWPRRWT